MNSRLRIGRRHPSHRASWSAAAKAGWARAGCGEVDYP